MGAIFILGEGDLGGGEWEGWTCAIYSKDNITPAFSFLKISTNVPQQMGTALRYVSTPMEAISVYATLVIPWSRMGRLALVCWNVE